MPIELRWYEPDCIMLAEYNGFTSLQEQLVMTDRFILCLGKSARNIHLLADFRKATNYPFQFGLMAKTIEMLRHERMGWVAVVGMNPVVNYWVTIFKKIAGLRCSEFETREEAARFLRAKDTEPHYARR